MSLRKQATSGIFWTFGQQFGNQILSFVVTLILARLLLPREFGLIGMIAIFVGIGRVLIESGLAESLIRQTDIDEDDYSTIFYSNLIFSILVYFGVYFAAPFISEFYDQPLLTPLVRIYCVSFIIGAFSTVQQARLTKMMDFKTQTLISIPSTLLGGAIGIILAYNNFGVWSLVWSQITTNLTSTVQLWFFSGWVPVRRFSFLKFKRHFNFGYKLTLSGLLQKIVTNSYLLVIGKLFSAAQVGFYTRADTMKQLPVSNISVALNKVTYPLFASIKDDDIRLKRVYSELMRAVLFVLAPILIFLAVLAEPVFRLLFTEKWLPAAPYFQILCLAGIAYPISAYNLNILKVKGRTDLMLKLNVVKQLITIVAVVVGVQFGIFGLLYAQVILSILVFFINAHYTDKFINYSAPEQIKDLIPILVLTAFCGFSLFILDEFLKDSRDIIRIFTGGLGASGLYLSLSFFFKFSSFFKIKELILK